MTVFNPNHHRAKTPPQEPAALSRPAPLRPPASLRRPTSLRVRLTAIILLPVLAVAVLAGLWQLNNARHTAADVFNRTLLTTAFAVANDVALSEGDALSPRTRDILSDTSGGPVFYHVYAPDGVIVAGYATPPVGIPPPGTEPNEPIAFEATYYGQPVTGVRIQTRTQVDGFAGIFTTTVWQDTAVRSAFVTALVSRSVITISALILTLALIIWFGVRLGLRPLSDLQDAIAQRSSDELSPIKRPVPTEVQGVVDRINTLFSQVLRSINAQSDFISNAAHQLRNPIAGILSLAEAVHRASDANDVKKRSADLVAVARDTAALTDRLLLLERAKSISPPSSRQVVDLGACLKSWVDDARDSHEAGPEISLVLYGDLGCIPCDATMLGEAVKNLIDNAIVHGGHDLSEILVRGERMTGRVKIEVADDGVGVPDDALATVTDRFMQAGSGVGSGLGLSIAKAVAESHGGFISVANRSPGLSVTLTF